MSKTTRLAVLAVSLMSLIGALASSAGAVTWHNSGSTAFTGTAGPATLTSTGASASCTSATGTGTAPALVVGLTYSVSGTLTLSGCTLAGIATGVDCAYTLTGTSQSGAVISGTADVTCSAYQFGTKICHAGGTVSGTYTNGTPGVATLTTGGNVVVSNGSSGTCPLGSGDRVHLTTISARSTSANPPFITRTA